jgi:hypothetical protein
LTEEVGDPVASVDERRVVGHRARTRDGLLRNLPGVPTPFEAIPHLFRFLSAEHVERGPGLSRRFDHFLIEDVDELEIRDASRFEDGEQLLAIEEAPARNEDAREVTFEDGRPCVECARAKSGAPQRPDDLLSGGSE